MPKHKTIKITENMRVGALFEHLDEKVDLVLEQFVDVKKTLDLHTKLHESHGGRLDNLNMIVDKHTGQLNTLTTKVDAALETKADKKNLHKLENRVLALEN